MPAFIGLWAMLAAVMGGNLRDDLWAVHVTGIPGASPTATGLNRARRPVCPDEWDKVQMNDT